MLGLRDDLNVGVGDGMLRLEAGGPLGRAAHSQCLDLGFEGIVLPSQKLDVSTVVGPKGPLRLLLFVADEAVVALGKVMVQAAKEILPFVEEAFGWAAVGGLLEAKVFADVPVGVLVVEDVVPKGLACCVFDLAEGDVPSVNKVNGQAVHNGPRQADANVGPAHPRVLGAVNCEAISITTAELELKSYACCSPTFGHPQSQRHGHCCSPGRGIRCRQDFQGERPRWGGLSC